MSLADRRTRTPDEPVTIAEVRKLCNDNGALSMREEGVRKTFATLAETWQWANREPGPRADAGLELARAAIAMLTDIGPRELPRGMRAPRTPDHSVDSSADDAGRQLLSPIVMWLRRSGQLADAQAELAALAERRPAVARSIVPEVELAQERPSAAPLASVSTDADDQELMDLWLTTAEGDDEWRGEQDERLELIRRWVELRRALAPDARARTDVRLLNHATTHRQWLPAEYSEALHDDIELWKCAPAREFARSLRAPLVREDVGLAAAALINVRLAPLNPAAFLRRLDAPLLGGVADVVDLQALPREQLVRLGTYLLTVIQRLNLYVGKAGQQPLKRDLWPLLKQLDSALLLLHLEPWLQQGGQVPFDSTVHDSDEPLTPGVSVRVVRPGLRSRDDPDFLVKPWVEPIDSPVGVEAADLASRVVDADVHTPGLLDGAEGASAAVPRGMGALSVEETPPMEEPRRQDARPIEETRVSSVALHEEPRSLAPKPAGPRPQAPTLSTPITQTPTSQALTPKGPAARRRQGKQKRRWPHEQ